jgi:hypothetical protein
MKESIGFWRAVSGNDLKGLFRVQPQPQVAEKIQQPWVDIVLFARAVIAKDTIDIS